MKRFQAEYSETSITYWPIYEAGKIGRIFLVVLGTLFITTSILILLDNPLSATFWGILVIFPLVVAALYYAFSYISRTMYTKIVVSTEGIVFFTLILFLIADTSALSSPYRRQFPKSALR